MKKLIATACVILFCTVTHAQELFVNTEPASNMATGSIGFRVLSKVYKMNYNHSSENYRIMPELMIGASKHVMVHVAGYGSDMFQKKLRIEGGSLYAKYRFYSQDDVHEHFRMAAFSKISLIDNPQQLWIISKKRISEGNGVYATLLDTAIYKNDEFDIDGNNSGIIAGIVATKLINKIAASGSLEYGFRLNNINNKVLAYQSLHAINYSASFGYLLFPHEYVNYKQTNVNLYMEVLGSVFPSVHKSFVDIAPSIQFIFNSIARLDCSYRAQFAGNTLRLSNKYFMVRLEYNILNAF